MSFLTMMGPSPDWNVGLSAEDLCTKECGWVQKVVQDLIPWDAGTDSGVTYEVGVPPQVGVMNLQSTPSLPSSVVDTEMNLLQAVSCANGHTGRGGWHGVPSQTGGLRRV